MKKIIAIGVLCLAASPQLFAGTIVGSKHDLGKGNYFGDTGQADTSEICVFCHTPHGANNQGEMAGAPLWNRRITDTTSYLMYTSPTMDASCLATPSGVSLACLSCHDAAAGNGVGGGDGAVSAGNGSGDQHDLVNPSNSVPDFALSGGAGGASCNACHGESGRLPEDTAGSRLGPSGSWPKLMEEWQIGNDLGNDHPISILYADTLADDRFFNTPPDPVKGWSDVKLYEGRVECPSCHNPHDPDNRPFLRKTINGSALCLTCHNK
ncbi:MAG: cytochrome c3 family protein [Candidatus Polarisedimenticolaceae bacterium]|nr:cytochrome c3 family protein [Candidatus Polarisedimenticolaceae bacterium]